MDVWLRRRKGSELDCSQLEQTLAFVTGSQVQMLFRGINQEIMFFQYKLFPWGSIEIDKHWKCREVCRDFVGQLHFVVWSVYVFKNHQQLENIYNLLLC